MIGGCQEFMTPKTLVSLETPARRNWAFAGFDLEKVSTVPSGRCICYS